VENPTSFRDRVSTVDASGHRVWIFPKKPKGSYYSLRTLWSYFQLILLFTAPFISINGKPLILLDILQRRFVIFGVTFWPHDFFILGLVVISFIVLIILFTTIYGRIWCGWLCPQTVFLEMLFRKIEYFIDGDSIAQKRLMSAPWNAEKTKKRITKHSIYILLSFVMGNVFLAYFIGKDALLEIITDPPSQHIVGLSIMILFSLTFYWIYAYFREQACCFLCPYARLQSVLLDDNSIGVIYDHVRGETRGKRNTGSGDCIDCNLCQAVCPTGIDIRNGSPQLECIQCTACMDACDHVMTKRKKPKGLIKYASQNMIDNNSKFKVTTRIILYTTILALLFSAIFFLIVTRREVETTLIRNRGSVAIMMGDKVTNLYSAKILNKTSQPIQYELKLQGNGDLDFTGGVKTIQPESNDQASFFVKLPKETVKSGKNKINIDVYINGELAETLETSFLGI